MPVTFENDSGKEPNAKLKVAFEDLWELRVETAYPFLMEVYNDYENGLVTVEEFVEIVRLMSHMFSAG